MSCEISEIVETSYIDVIPPPISSTSRPVTTPQTIIKANSTRRPIEDMIRSRQKSSTKPTTSARGRSLSSSRALSVSSSFIDESTELSLISSSRRSRRASHVPPPPDYFEENFKRKPPMIKGFAVNRLCREPSQEARIFRNVLQHEKTATYPHFQQLLRATSNTRKESPHRASPRWNVF